MTQGLTYAALCEIRDKFIEAPMPEDAHFDLYVDTLSQYFNILSNEWSPHAP